MFTRPRRTLSALVLCAVLAPFALVACGGGDDEDAGATATVTSGPRTTEIRSNKFESPLKVTAGSEVTWVNSDGIPHNVIGQDDAFSSDSMDEDDTFSHTFSTAGRFVYTCTFHPGMNGVVEVQ
jgi:plastocyanin